MKKVSADTITELTVSSGSLPGNEKPPTTQQMISQLRVFLAQRVKNLEQPAKDSRDPAAGPDAPPTPFEISYHRAVANVHEFEKIIKNVPEGFRLTPVLYTTIDQAQNNKIKREFSARVRPDFLNFLAENHAPELIALGIGPRGIDQMKRGLYPVDDCGNLYEMNIDHIIECFGGGKMSLTQAPDPQMPAGSKPTYMVNHFGNFILLPIQIHEFKNKLNGIQEASRTPTGQSKWVLMMVPETGPGRSGYIAPPQKPQHPLYGLKVHREDTRHLIKHADYMVNQVHALTITTAGQPEKQEIFLKPAIADLTQRLQTAFDDAAQPRQSHKIYKTFVRLYQGQKMTALRAKTKDLPMEEVVEMQKALQQIDKSIQERFNRFSAPPVNDNKPPMSNKAARRKQQHGRKRRH